MKLDDLTNVRPERAQDLAQGKAYSPPPWVTRHTNHLAALKGQDTAQQFFSCPVGAAEFYRDIYTQGGAAIKFLWRLPWARSCAPSGQKITNFMLHSPFCPRFQYIQR